MPDAETNVYWHELPNPVPPCDLQHLLRRAAGIEAPVVKAVAPPSRRENFRALRLDPSLTLGKALDEVLLNLGVAPVAEGELRSALQQAMRSLSADVATGGTKALFGPGKERLSAALSDGLITLGEDPRELVSDPPLLRGLRSILHSRGLRLETMDRRRSGETLAAATDFIPHERAVFFVDRERPVFAAAIALPPARSDAKLNCVIELLLPVRDPVPVRLRCTVIRGVSRNETLVLKVFKDLQTGGGGGDRSVALGTSQGTPSARHSDYGDDSEVGASSEAESLVRLPSAAAASPVGRFSARPHVVRRSLRRDDPAAQRGPLSEEALAAMAAETPHHPTLTRRRGSSTTSVIAPSVPAMPAILANQPTTTARSDAKDLSALISALPVVECAEKTRLKRSIKSPWYVRLMPVVTRRRFRTLVAQRFAQGAESSSTDDDDDSRE